MTKREGATPSLMAGQALARLPGSTCEWAPACTKDARVCYDVQIQDMGPALKFPSTIRHSSLLFSCVLSVFPQPVFQALSLLCPEGCGAKQ